MTKNEIESIEPIESNETPNTREEAQPNGSTLKVEINEIFSQTVLTYKSKLADLNAQFELALSAYLAGKGYNVSQYNVGSNAKLTEFYLTNK